MAVIPHKPAFALPDPADADLRAACVYVGDRGEGLQRSYGRSLGILDINRGQYGFRGIPISELEAGKITELGVHQAAAEAIAMDARSGGAGAGLPLLVVRRRGQMTTWSYISSFLPA